MLRDFTTGLRVQDDDEEDELDEYDDEDDEDNDDDARPRWDERQPGWSD